MELRFTNESLGLGAFQAGIAIVAVLVLAVLVWRAIRAVLSDQATSHR